MSTITRDQLRERAREKVKSLEFAVTQTAFADSRSELEEELELARIALASLEAEAVGFICRHKETGKFGSYLHPKADWFKNDEYEVLNAYITPPAPVSVPDESAVELLATDLMKRIDKITGERHSVATLSSLRVSVVESCRSAVLQGAAGNSPVIPDGWALVPVEPTEDMIVNGFESEPDESFSDEKEWEAYNAMSGCQQAAHRAKLCWVAMIAAAMKIDISKM